MPKYWGKQIFAHRRFPEVGEKQKMEKEKKKRLNDGNNNGQLRFVRNHVWRTQARLDQNFQSPQSKFKFSVQVLSQSPSLSLKHSF